MSTNTDAKKRNKFSLILYANESSPRYFEVNKSLFKFILIGLPFITIVSLFFLGFGGVYFKQLKLMAKRKEPRVISALREENEKLQIQLVDTTKLNEELQNKLASSSTSEGTKLGSLSIFKQIPGQKDLTTSPQISVEDIGTFNDSKNIRLQFRIVNQTKDNQRLSGFLFIVLKAKNTFSVWPTKNIDSTEMQIQFNDGEYFATSRFRPVDAPFPLIENGSEVIFNIVIFSRTGDLLYKKLHSTIINY